MAKTRIKHTQVLDSDFASEAEMAEFVASKISEYDESIITVPEITGEEVKFLKYDGSNYVWDDVNTTDPNKLLPAVSEENQILKSNSNGDWVIVAADDPVEGLTVMALPYYYDSVREKYLGNEVIRVANYISGSGREDEYQYYIPGIRSCAMPFNIFEGEKYCLVGLEYNSENAKSGEILEYRTITGSTSGAFGGTTYEYETLGTLDLGSDEVTEKYIDNLDIVLEAGTKLCSYLLEDVDVDNPAIIMMLRRIWEPDDEN
jgi:hypothetical protein